MTKVLYKLIEAAPGFVPVAGRLLGALCQFIIVACVSKSVDYSSAGDFFGFQIWCGLSSAIGQFGLSIISLRLVSIRDKFGKNFAQHVAAIFLILTTTSFIAGLVGGVLRLYFGGVNGLSAGAYLAAFVCTTISLSVLQVSSDILRSQGSNYSSSLSSFSGPFLSVIAIIIIWAGSYSSPVAYILSISFCYLAAATFVFSKIAFFVFPYISCLENRLKVILLAACLVRKAASSFLTSIFAYISSQSDVFVLSMLCKKSDFAAYVVGAKCAQVASVCIAAVNPVVSTSVLNMYKAQGLRRAQSHLSSMNAACLAASICAAIVSCLVFNRFGVRFFGKIFEEARPVAEILLLSALINFATGPKGFYLWVAGYDQSVRRIVAVSAAFTAIASLTYILTRSIADVAFFVFAIQISQYAVEAYVMNRLTGLYPIKVARQ